MNDVVAVMTTVVVVVMVRGDGSAEGSEGREGGLRRQLRRQRYVYSRIIIILMYLCTCRMVKPDLRMMSSISGALSTASGFIMARVRSANIKGVLVILSLLSSSILGRFALTKSFKLTV